ncbi:uncharacterized protein LOC110453389 [Mizuhopecten yessoensis]|uniref:Uncharacterized protein n=1 Tax=Mizuhopecten yessoensis TaxID=6573 RepID=A0A210QHF9_MIZYE|nr:uncharacterized protein LOC110453389 [Mizuhopecten yessoensis]OWF48215.1 hypothetical protein KP79_PYT14494 [Mizuhopecten yessoensis]
MATGETSHVIAIESEEVKNSVSVSVPVVGLRVQLQQSNGARSKTMTVEGTDVGTDGTTTKQPDNNNRQLNHTPTKSDDSPATSIPPAIATSCHNDHLYSDFDIPSLRSNGNQSLDSGNEKIKAICNGEVDSMAEEAMGNSNGTGCTIGSSDDIKTLNGFVIGNGGMEDQGSKGCQAVRPKTISWSRLVKQRKDKKERNKKQNNIRDQSRGEAYLYPEMYSSSEEDLDDIVPVPAEDSKTSTKSQAPKSSSGGTNWNLHLVCETTDSAQEWTRPFSSKSSSRCNKDGIAKPECIVNGTVPSSESTDSNESKTSSTGSGQCPPFDPVLMVKSDCILAPLAVPEDSGGSSLSSGSDSNFNPDDFLCDNLDYCSCGNAMCRYSQSQTSHGQFASQVVEMNNISCEENMPKPESEMRSPFMPFLPNAQIQQLPRPASNDSLDEIGDYIDTDFPSQASRLLFACSSTSSSSTSSDEDEGYGVNAEPRIPDFSEREEDRNELPVPKDEPLPFHEGKANGHREDESESRVLFLDDSPSDLKLCDRLSNHVCSKDSDHDCKTKPLSRLDSCTGKSESGSEVGGQIESDSSVVYSPETDFLEFVDSDLPGSAGLHQSFSFVRDAEILTPFLSDGRCYPNNCDSVHQASLANSCEEMLAEGAASLTNNLNYDRCCTDFDDFDNNMERYDPHLHVDNENFHTYCNPDLCKQDKVPGANFQNSASNRREKVFYKAAMDRENRLSSGSSDEEENVSQSFMRDVASNLEGQENHAPQNSNTECMYMGDLENLTHALQNAVIMQLPPKLEESSGESSDEPIYEEINECLEPLLMGDNSLHVVKEEVMNKSADNVARVLPKCEQRRRRGNKPHCHIEKVMIWNEYEAYVLQVKQIGTSACGPTAVLNVMKAFDCQVDKEEICKTILANLRMEGAPIPYYLFSRSAAGTTAENLLEGVEKLTKGVIRGRFFSFYPPRKVELLKWLGYWLKKGAVPIATLNLQRGVKPGWTIPDAWHHQMVYGVSSKGVYLTNPLEIVPAETIMDQLTSDSVLLVRRQDVVNRFRDWAPLNDFLKQRDTRWQTWNVLGQVVNVLREACTALSHQIPRHRAQLTSHITIPAAYKAGITLFVRQNSEVAEELLSAQELELRDGSEMETENLNGMSKCGVESELDITCASASSS